MSEAPGHFEIFNVLSAIDQKQSTPWATYAITALLLVAFGITSRFPQYLNDWGFYTHAPFRLLGSTWITSTLLHVGTSHLLSNLLFFVLFASSVELSIGTYAFLELVGVSAITAKVGYLFFPPADPTLVVGTSGIVFGIMAYFCFANPRARITIPLFFHMKGERAYNVKTTVPAITFFLGYLAFNLWAFYAQTSWLPQLTGLRPKSELDAFLANHYIETCKMLSHCNYALVMIVALMSSLGGTAFLGHLGGAVGGLLMYLGRPTLKLPPS